MNYQMNKYPLSGFSKISYEEFLGILYILKLYTGLSQENKDIIDLAMDGLKFRENRNEIQKKTSNN